MDTDTPTRMDSLALQLDILQAIVLELVERLPPAQVPAVGRHIARVIAVRTGADIPKAAHDEPAITQVDELVDALRRRH